MPLRPQYLTLKKYTATFAPFIHNFSMDHVGKRIKALRVSRNLTQTEVAKAIGIKQGSFTQLETGLSKAPAASTLIKLAHFFEVDPEWLMTGKGSRQSVSALTEQESELLLLYRGLSPESRDYILGRARSVHQDEFRPKRLTSLRKLPPPLRDGDGDTKQ